jgi:4-hydroxybenzoate polyprenyltransferase/phosphoserine phosphatase
MASNPAITFPASPQEQPMETADVPIVVDLDGTLVCNDLLLECVLALLRRSPLSLLLLPFWLLKGRARLKAEIASRVELDCTGLPLNQPLLARLRKAKARGRTLVLATGSNEQWARRIADELGLFDEVLASDASRNLTGREKLAALRARFGSTGFDYIGNCSADYPLWQAARRATVVNASPRVARWVTDNATLDEILPGTAPGFMTYVRALRLHQWLKNLLLFAPLIAAHKLADLNAVIDLGIAFLAFGLCASSVYVLNDMMDLSDDRRHPAKCKRPFASGELPLAHGLVLIPLLLAGAAALTLLLPWQFGLVLAGYYAMTLAYTFFLKRHEAVDVVTLALLYTSRILAGGAAAGIDLSVWLLTFSTFIFLSLALAKRCAELFVLKKQGDEATSGRGYRVADLPVLFSMGIGSSYVAALVLALYLSSTQVRQAYDHPQLLWAFVPVLIYWSTRVWLITCRAGMHDDPLVFTARDRLSLALAAGCGGIIWAAM